MTGPGARDRCCPSALPFVVAAAACVPAFACSPREHAAPDGDPRADEDSEAVVAPRAPSERPALVADSGELGSGAAATAPDAGGSTSDGLAQDEAIERAITLIEASDLTFVGPRKGEPPDVYSGIQFSRVLRRKWRWIGADIHGLEVWIDEIASKSFRSDLPYRVRTAEGDDRPFAPWLRERIAESPW